MRSHPKPLKPSEAMGGGNLTFAEDDGAFGVGTIIGNHRQSEAIRINPRQSEAIRGNLTFAEDDGAFGVGAALLHRDGHHLEDLQISAGDRREIGGRSAGDRREINEGAKEIRGDRMDIGMRSV